MNRLIKITQELFSDRELFSPYSSRMQIAADIAFCVIFMGFIYVFVEIVW